MPLYEFVCDCGTVTEALCSRDTAAVACPQCGNEAGRRPFYAAAGHIAAVHDSQFVNDHGHYRLDLFEEASAEAGDRYERRRQQGEQVKTPNYLGQGLKMARQRDPRIGL